MAVKQGKSKKAERAQKRQRRGIQPGDKPISRRHLKKNRRMVGSALPLGSNDRGVMGVIEGASWQYDSTNNHEQKPLMHPEIRSHIFKKLFEAIEKVANNHNWSEELRDSATAYMRALVFGDGSFNTIGKKMAKAVGPARRKSPVIPSIAGLFPIFYV